MALALSALPGPVDVLSVAPSEFFAAADKHGVSGVLWEALRSASPSWGSSLVQTLEARATARALDYEAHLAMLRRIDEVLVEHGIDALVLKGPLLARRYYRQPSARGTSDIDLLVRERDVERTIEALSVLGFVWRDSDIEQRYRREHHHLHLFHPAAPALELHFHAQSAFGITLRSEWLIEGGEVAEGFRSLRVPESVDELVYLAVHAASHRFGRLSWLYDMKLLVLRLSSSDLARARERAVAWGYGRVLALTAALLVDVLGVPADVVAPLGRLDGVRSPFLRSLVREPEQPILRAATRFAYSTMLADSMGASMKYAASASSARLRGLFRSER